MDQYLVGRLRENVRVKGRDIMWEYLKNLLISSFSDAFSILVKVVWVPLPEIG